MRAGILFILVLLFFAGCAGDSGIHRAPIHGWHSRDHKDAPASYHTPHGGSNSTPF